MWRCGTAKPGRFFGCVGQWRLAICLLVTALGAGATAPPAAGRGPEPRMESRVAVLYYHHLDHHQTSAAIQAPETFREHLQRLQDLGLPVISLDALAAFLEGKEPLPPRAVVITFDDGYESFYTEAYPELLRFGYPAAVFVIVRPTDRPRTVTGLPHLSWTEIEEMLGSGLVTVGSHTYDQHEFSPRFRSGPEVATHRIAADYAAANQAFRINLGLNPEYFAFPYGRSSSELARLARGAGYRYLFTTKPRTVTAATDPLAIPRYHVGMADFSADRLEELLRSVLGLRRTAANELSDKGGEVKRGRWRARRVEIMATCQPRGEIGGNSRWQTHALPNWRTI